MEYAHATDQIKVAVNMNAMDAVLSASPVVQLTLIILILMSVISWAIIFQKKKQFDLVKKSDEEFLEHFWKAKSLDEIYSKGERYENSPIARTFMAGFKELQQIAESNLAKENKLGTPILAGLDNVKRALRKNEDLEISNFESRMGFLATTGSTSPFIGLFGTVWGIMGSFQKIGATGAASLAVVAPGISEALIATAVGLATAIPAVIAYNHYLTRLNKCEMEISNFNSDFLNVIKRNFFKED